MWWHALWDSVPMDAEMGIHPQELQLYAVVNHPVVGLGTELWPSGKQETLLVSESSARSAYFRFLTWKNMIIYKNCVVITTIGFDSIHWSFSKPNLIDWDCLLWVVIPEMFMPTIFSDKTYHIYPIIIILFSLLINGTLPTVWLWWNNSIHK